MYANGANVSFAAPKNYHPETMINTEQASNCFNTVEFGLRRRLEDLLFCAKSQVQRLSLIWSKWETLIAKVT